MKLVLKFDGHDVQEFVFEKAEITIGRTSKNDITIDNLAISSLHATIYNTEEGAVLKDNNSTNGVFVNENKINSHQLKEGDVIGIGKHKICYFAESSDSPSLSNKEQGSADDDATIMMSPDFQKQLQQEVSKHKKVTRKIKKKKGLWGTIKALFGLS